MNRVDWKGVCHHVLQRKSISTPLVERYRRALILLDDRGERSRSIRRACDREVFAQNADARRRNALSTRGKSCQIRIDPSGS